MYFRLHFPHELLMSFIMNIILNNNFNNSHFKTTFLIINNTENGLDTSGLTPLKRMVFEVKGGNNPGYIYPGRGIRYEIPLPRDG